MSIQLPSERVLARAETLGRLINAYLPTIVAGLFLAVYFGWLPSPLFSAVQANREMLLLHARESELNAAHRRQESEALVRALSRMTDVLKMLDCADITDRVLRERCLNR